MIPSYSSKFSQPCDSRSRAPRRSTLISPRTGFNSVCVREENGTPCQQRVCVRWCHHLCLVLPVGVLIVLKLQFLVSNWSRTFGCSPEQCVFPLLWVYLSIVFCGIGLLFWCYVVASAVTGTRIPGVRGQGRPEVCKGPWSLRGSRGYAPHGYMGLMAGHAACCTQYTRCCPFGPCTGAIHGAPGHNRWGVVETPLPVKTQGGTMNCFLMNWHDALECL